MVRVNLIRARYVFAIGLGLVLLGLGLVIANSATSGTGGGCFFWPFPVVVVCGAGSSGTAYPLIIVGLVVALLISFMSFVWMRRSATGPTTDKKQLLENEGLYSVGHYSIVDAY